MTNQILKLSNQYPILRKYGSPMMSILYEGRSVTLTRRRELYFLGNFGPYYWYVEARNAARDQKPQEIGLLMDNNDWEYPLWVLLDRHASQGFPKIYHIEVDNITASINMNLNPYPEIIMATNNEYKDMVAQHGYEIIYTSDHIQVLKK